jgi:para-aminobenzoate synthetase/4-amino-4-deoxychorismate lyase
VKLSSLAQQEAFALLGPGFSGGPWTLLRGLSPSTAEDANLAFVAYEDDSAHPRLFHGYTTSVDTLDLDVAAPALDVHLLTTREEHAAAVETIRGLIADGDVYQVNHTVRATLPPVSGAQLLAALCARGTPRFAAWVRFPDGTELVSASPELFFEVDGTRVHVEPMKGTAGPSARVLLENSEKDTAELAMITDLLRNDLVPVCVPHSVQVACPRRLLELPYVVQAVSDVEGTLQPHLGALDVLRALHPGGSITGAPKRAAMDVIRRLEPLPRGPYCGGLGLLSPGRATFSLLIRTASRTGGGWLYGTGGGIVFDSVASQEFAELHLKLGALQCATRS